MTSRALAGLSSESMPPNSLMTMTRPFTKSYDCVEVDSFNNGAIVDRARYQIDEEIAKLDESARALKSRRNTLVSISRLPPEMLSKIFTFCTSTGQTDYTSGNLSWIKLSHICRHWRAVALDCPSLWSCIVFSRPKWAAEMLKRSKVAPLVIKADLTYMTPKMVDAMQSALEHLSRIQELHITASTATIEKLLSTLCSDANRLQSFCISNSQYADHYVTAGGCTLPENIFNSVAPHLRRLDLIRCNLCWDSPLLNGLIHLKVHGTMPSLCPTVTELISVLEKMPKLETLDLKGCLPSIPDTATTAPFAECTVSLPHLSVIRISSSVLECANVLNHLSFPATASIHLSCWATETTDNDFSSIFPTFSNICSSTEPLRSLLIRYVSPTGIRFQAWTSTGGLEEFPSSLSSPRIELKLMWAKNDRNKAEQVVAAVCKALPLAHLTSLHMGLLDRIGKNLWLNSFGTLPKLRNVRVQGDSTGDSVHGLIEALVAEVNEEQQAAMGTVGRKPSLRRKKSIVPAGVYFPGLHRLVLEETDFEAYQPLCDLLSMCLMERYERGAEVRELILVECIHLYECDVKLLEEIVVDVDWDEIEQGTEEEDSVASRHKF